MVEQEWQGRSEPASLRRALRLALRRSAPSLRVVAEDVLGEVSSIDLLAVGEDGELVAIRVAPDAAEGADARLLTRALADLTWLRPRIADLIKLAPGLGLELGVEPRAIAVAPHFGAEAVAAAENLPARSLELLRWRGVREQGQLAMRLEPEKPGLVRATPPPDRIEPATAVRPAPRRRTPALAPTDLGAPVFSGRAEAAPPAGAASPALPDPPSPSTFRTGLTDADLRLESRPAEI